MIRYADRMFISVNGSNILDVQSATIKQNLNSKVVPTMTPDRYNRGFVRGNTDYDVTVQIAVQTELSRPKLDFIDYGANDVQLTAVFGADQFVVTGLFIKDSEDAAPGPGETVKTTFNFSALKLVDGVGNSVLFNVPSLTILA